VGDLDVKDGANTAIVECKSRDACRGSKYDICGVVVIGRSGYEHIVGEDLGCRGGGTGVLRGGGTGVLRGGGIGVVRGGGIGVVTGWEQLCCGNR